jgi:hypothetical protein
MVEIRSGIPFRFIKHGPSNLDLTVGIEQIRAVVPESCGSYRLGKSGPAHFSCEPLGSFDTHPRSSLIERLLPIGPMCYV